MSGVWTFLMQLLLLATTALTLVSMVYALYYLARQGWRALRRRRGGGP